jgi:hypothetical protein
MWNSLWAAVRWIATAAGIAREPSYVIVRPRRDREERDVGERAA